MESGLLVLSADYPEGELGQIKMWEQMIMDNGMKLPSYDVLHHPDNAVVPVVEPEIIDVPEPK